MCWLKIRHYLEILICTPFEIIKESLQILFWLGTIGGIGLWQIYKSIFLRLLFYQQQLKNIFRFFSKNLLKILNLVRQKLVNILNSLKTWPRKFYFVLGVIMCFLFLFIPYALIDGISQLPHPTNLVLRDIPVTTRIYDRKGILLYQIYADENRSLVKIQDIPKYVIDATIAIEDRKFYNHPGIDPVAMFRAALANYRNEEIQGGSTLTQQLVKSALLTPERSVKRKIKEIFLALWTEKMYSKQDILQMYLNQIPYGGAAYGIEAAAKTYFSKNAKDLTLAQAALLAGLPAAPSDYSPFGPHPKLAKVRQLQVLDAMVQEGMISQFVKEQAAKEQLDFAPFQTEIKAPHFVMYVKDYLTKKFGIKVVERGGLEVITSLDYELYQKSFQILKDELQKQSYLKVGNAAALILNPNNGEILSMIGSKDYFDVNSDGNVNITLSPRSPGSAIKPLVYALALEKHLITPATFISDVPITYKLSNGQIYNPQNYDNKFHGNVSVRTALASSYNIPAVKVMEKIGVKNFVSWSTDLGITSFNDSSRYGLALSLGGGEVTMIDLVSAYASLAHEGKKVFLDPIIKITNAKGHLIQENNQITFPQAFSPETAYLVSHILSDNQARAPTFGITNQLNFKDKMVAVKTGTTQEKRDNWTIGYTPNILLAVWVGNNDNSPMNPSLESGRTGAAAIWNPIMSLLLEQILHADFKRPSGLIEANICVGTHLLTCDFCPHSKKELFISGTQPTRTCHFKKENLQDQPHKETSNKKGKKNAT